MATTHRPYREGDLEALLDLWRRARWDAQPWLEERLGHSAEDDRRFFTETGIHDGPLWVAERGDEVVAFLQLCDDVAAQCGRVERLYVAPEAQGTGVGSALLAFAKERYPGGLALSTHQRNERARRFYEARGFEAVAFGVSAPPESEPDVAYRWRP